MSVLVLKTGHQIADTVAESLGKCFGVTPRLAEQVDDLDVAQCEFVIGYGILRGTGDIFKLAERLGKPWFVVDKGYFGASHYNGYYRMGYRGTQGPYKPRAVDPCIMPERQEQGKCLLICPPTSEVCRFFGIDYGYWIATATQYAATLGVDCIVRSKDSHIPLEDDLAKSFMVYTFNSSVGWIAKARGLQVISDATRSIVGQAMPVPSEDLIAWLLEDQFTLKDVEAGLLRVKCQSHLT